MLGFIQRRATTANSQWASYKKEYLLPYNIITQKAYVVYSIQYTIEVFAITKNKTNPPGCWWDTPVPQMTSEPTWLLLEYAGTANDERTYLAADGIRLYRKWRANLPGCCWNTQVPQMTSEPTWLLMGYAGTLNEERATPSELLKS